MSSMLRTMRFVRPAMPLRVMVARPAMMARGYPARSEMSDDEAERLAREKELHLKGDDKHSQTISHAPGWNESLASDSEANVKAEKEDLSGISVEELQEKTVKHVHEKHHKSH